MLFPNISSVAPKITFNEIIDLSFILLFCSSHTLLDCLNASFILFYSHILLFFYQSNSAIFRYIFVSFVPFSSFSSLFVLFVFSSVISDPCHMIDLVIVWIFGVLLTAFWSPISPIVCSRTDSFSLLLYFFIKLSMFYPHSKIFIWQSLLYHSSCPSVVLFPKIILLIIVLCSVYCRMLFLLYYSYS